MAQSKKIIKVLIVDDSALIRQVLTEILSQDSQIEVVGTAPDPLKARELIKKTQPDVLTLDVEMPKMNGIDFLKKVMKLRPMPVIMISSLTEKGADITLEALEIGAVDFVLKPKIDIKKGFADLSNDIVEKVKLAAQANVHLISYPKLVPSFDAVNPKSSVSLIAMGASTGGVEAIRYILNDLPDCFPPIVIVQHMPANILEQFAKRLDLLSKRTIKIAEQNQSLKWGQVYIAPGNKHLKILERSDGLTFSISKGEPVRGHIPSVDVFFHSVATLENHNAVGVILSGMGKDGAEGLLAMRDNSFRTIGQSEQTCVVYGMPKVAKKIGAIEKETDLDQIANNLISIVNTVN